MTLTVEEREALQERIRQAPALLIAERIKKARQDYNGDGTVISHDKFGALFSPPLSRQHLIKLEGAKHRPRADMLARIAEATGRSVDWFLDTAPQPFRGRLADGDGGRVDRRVAGAEDGEAVA
jgi:transcriptional regulator with XRE-family HTH domain